MPSYLCLALNLNLKDLSVNIICENYVNDAVVEAVVNSNNRCYAYRKSSCEEIIPDAEEQTELANGVEN